MSSYPDFPFDPTLIIVYGGGGHGKTLVDLLRSLGNYRILGFVDDGIPAGTQIMGLPVLGGREILPDLHRRGVRLAANGVGGIGDVDVRLKAFEILAGEQFSCPTLVHPTAWVEPSAVLEDAVQVLPQGYVATEARIGAGVGIKCRGNCFSMIVFWENASIFRRGPCWPEG